ncbi:hypothetical protein V8G54_018481, partial [Vigna mungo]
MEELTRKGSSRLSSSNDPFNPTNFLIWIWCHSLILNCCHSKHLFVLSLSLSLILSLSLVLCLLFSLFFFSLSSALSLSNAEGDSYGKLEHFGFLRGFLFLSRDLSWVYGFYQGIRVQF